MCPLLAIFGISRACFLFFTNDLLSVAYASAFAMSIQIPDWSVANRL
jgi:hypothetical protein